ncbi:glycosyltransferase family 39 protein [Cognatiluteimonas telluris]|uniref:glycosyltransferase family 39 protein n=1 Tax=Cognatiluteimonas telluris TaxID=1104775 RepID=UPI001407F2FC|nr:glycosyltransferase family 39 protein [Lysobacter telluris]
MPGLEDAARQRRTLWWLLTLALLRFALHVALNGRYGFHRDELQVLTDARHLAWGFVAYPPLTPAFGRLELALFGTSLTGFRVFSALAQCAAMVLAGLIARELGGRRWAQLLAAVAVAATPFSLLTASEFMYVAFDGLWWVLLAWLVLRLVNSGDRRWWVGIGLAIGAGMMTRYSMLFCVAGLVAGVCATPLRAQLRSRWLWMGVAASLLVFLPNAWWQWQHDFISVDFLQSIHARDIDNGRTDGFLLAQLYANTGPLLTPLWLAGLWFVAFARSGARWRVLAWMYVVPLLLFWLAKGRDYYLAPAYPMLLAAGVVALQHACARMRAPRARALRATAWVLVLFCLVSVADMALPIAPVDSAGWQLSRKVHDNFAEQIGWPEYVAQVAAVYHALPASERTRTAIYANNYGEAGAIDLYGPQHGLPSAITPVNSGWYRGPGPTPTTVIVLGDDAEGISDAPATCTLAGRLHNAAGVANEETSHPDIYVCRDLRKPWQALWPAKPFFG